MSPTAAVELTMVVNHRIYVFCDEEAPNKLTMQGMIYLRGVFWATIPKCFGQLSLNTATIAKYRIFGPDVAELVD